MRLKVGLALVVSVVFLLAGFRPDALPYIRAQPRFSDAVTAHYPNALFLRESLLTRHELPLWRETTLSGQPFAANPLNKTAYPLQWLVLILPPLLHLNTLIALHLLIAGVGMWCWASTFALPPAALALATLSYVLAPRLFSHLAAGHLDILYALAWWPWLMWSLHQLHARPSLRQALLLSTVAALLLIADVRVSLYAYLTAALYTILLYRQSRKPLPFIRLGFTGIIFLLLICALIIPLLLWQPYINRASLTLEDAGALALQPAQLIGLFLPANNVDTETNIYLGLPTLALACFWLITRPPRQRLLLIVASLVVLGFAFGVNTPFWPLLASSFPPLRWFRVPARAWLIFTLLLPLAAAFGLQAFNAYLNRPHPLPAQRLRLLGWVAVLILLIVGLFMLLVLPQPAAGLTLLIAGAGSAFLFSLTLARRLSPSRFTVVLVALIVLDFAWTGLNWLTWRGMEFWLDPARPLAERLVTAGADRIYSPAYTLEQQVAAAYDLHLFGGVDPFQLAGVVTAIEQGSGVPLTRYEVVLPPLTGVTSEADLDRANQSAVIDTAVLGAWHVSHIVARYPIQHPRLQWLDTVAGAEIYTNLDYQPASTPSIPAWPPAWPMLPDSQTVSGLNQTTSLTLWISALAWIITIALLLILSRHPVHD